MSLSRRFVQICTAAAADTLDAEGLTPLESGVLAEQVNPYTNEPISVSPLTWSHATVVSTAIKYLEKLEQLQTCSSCHQPIYRLRRRGTVEVKSQAHFDRLDATFELQEGREMASAIGKFTRHDPRSRRTLRATLAIDIRTSVASGSAGSSRSPAWNSSVPAPMSFGNSAARASCAVIVR